MAINSPLFLLFMVWFLCVFHLVAGSRKEKRAVLLVASAMFIGSHGLWCVPWTLAQTGVTWMLGARITGDATRETRRRWLIAAIVVNVAALVGLKYLGFIARSLTGLLPAAAGWSALEFPRAPIGLSFYTLVLIGYCVDLYLGATRRHSLMTMLVSICFFPTITAGPIARSKLFAQLEAWAPLSWDRAKSGALLIATGVMNKAIGDMLGGQLLGAFSATEPQGALVTWTAAIAFTGQIYADFAGYTDIARGVALLVGVRIEPNFSLPYLARSPIEFWQRWHITLSGWLRDYLWLPLSLAFPRVPVVNLLLTMTLCGLWHGAAWTYVAWGLYNGLLLVATHWLSARFPSVASRRWTTAFFVGLTFYFVVLGRVLYRAPSLSGALDMLGVMHWPSAATTWTFGNTLGLVAALVAIAASHFVSALSDGRWKLVDRPRVLWPVTALLLLVASLSPGSQASFLYAQF